MILNIHLVPNAKREGIAGEFDGRVKIAVTAPAVDGRANEALIKFLSKEYGVPKSKISITAGLTGRNKIVKIGE
jgi:uncharacterized protein (TIGR00251 family)